MIDKNVLRNNLSYLSNINSSLLNTLVKNLNKIERNINIIENENDISIIYKGTQINNLIGFSRKKLEFLEKNIGIISQGEVRKNIPKDLLDLYDRLEIEKKENIKYIENLFILGTLPFFHIKFLFEEKKDLFPYLKNIFIFEDKLEFLYLFLSIVNLNKFPKNINVFLNIDKEKFKSNISALVFSFPINGYLKSYEDEAIKCLENEIKNIYKKSQVTLSYRSATNRINFFKRNIKLNTSRFLLDINENLKKKLNNIPLFIVGSGPSLDESVHILRDLQEKVIIISLTTAFKTLIDNDIKPDFVSIADSQKNMSRFLIGIKEEILKDTYCLSHIYVDTEFVSSFKENLIYAYSDFKNLLNIKDRIKKDFTLGSTVLNSTFDLCAELGFKNIYLLGVDLGTKHKGILHTKGYLDSDEKVLEQLKIVVEGNFGGTVLTKKDFYTSKLILESKIQSIKNIKVYNLSDGAKIEGSIPIKPDELSLKPKVYSKKEIVKYIKKIFKKEKVSIDKKELNELNRNIIPKLKMFKEQIKNSSSVEETIYILQNFIMWIILQKTFSNILFANEISSNIRFFLKILKLSPKDKKEEILNKNKDFILEQFDKIIFLAKLLSE